MSEKAPRCECGAIDGMRLGVAYPIYTFISKSGENTHIDSQRLRKSVLRNPPKIQYIPVEKHLVQEFLITQAVDQKRVAQLLIECDLGIRKLDPVILIHDGGFTNGKPDCLYVDGHHRYVLAYFAHQRSIPAYILEPSRWKAFEIKGLPPMTADQLIAAPLGKRNY